MQTEIKDRSPFTARSAAFVSTLLMILWILKPDLILPSAFGQMSAPAEGDVIPPSEWINFPAWSPDGKLVAVTWPAPKKVLLDTASGKPAEGFEANFEKQQSFILDGATFQKLPGRIPPMSRLLWSPDKALIAGHGLFMQPWCVFDVASGKLLVALPGDLIPLPEKSPRWSPDSKHIVTLKGSEVATIDIAGDCKPRSLSELAHAHATPVWSPDGTKLAALVNQGGDHWTMKICDSESGKTLHSLRITGNPGTIAWSKTGNWLAYNDTCLHVLNSSTMLETYKLKTYANAREPIFNWSNAGNYLSFIGADIALHIIRASDGKETTNISAEKTGRFRTSWSPNDKYLAIADANDKVSICEAQSGRYLGYKEFPMGSIVYWTPDSKSLVFPAMMGSSVQLVPLDFKPGGPVMPGALAGNPWQAQKVLKNLEDCFQALSLMLAPESIETIKNSEENTPAEGMLLGMGLRNQWGLREHNPLVEYFNQHGVTNGADMSGIIITSYWRHLNNRPIKFEEQCKQATTYQIDVAAHQTAIVKENRPLPEELIDFESESNSGAKLSISRLTGRAKVVSFIPKIFPSSLTLLKSLASLREKYTPERVSIVIFTFPAELLDPSYQVEEGTLLGQDRSANIDPDSSKIIADFLDHTNLPNAPANTEILKSLKKFAGRYLTEMNNGLPQTLIIDKNNKVVVRLNGWNFHDMPNVGPLQDAVEATLSGSNKKRQQ
ncbi:MAG: WD40 repeat domain-containing protein [Cyanobacteria bacterium SZAS TMP-1]|nr:WD40 repeat domain-containing protein [Cyanobacteria bacterium SZAS TMP-1]